jgi:hypothetical protein
MKPHWALVVVLLLAAPVFFTGINWGLPASGVNHYLFGDQPVWDGKKIIELAGGWEADSAIGSDVDRNPLHRNGRAIVLNETDAQRAEIIRRYRLFSFQPDEMITLRALAQIRPAAGQFDPKLYQYGGLWTYPVGGLLKLASVFRLIELTPDLAFYLDHPEAFGRFYVVARAYSALWGLAGLLVIYSIVQKFSDDAWLAPAAGLAFAVLPVVVCMSHEAKPHLAGAVLTLMAVFAAMKFLDAPSLKLAIIVGVLCGAASGMVLTAAPVFCILPVMVALCGCSWPVRFKWLSAAVAAGAAIYLISNPYVPINLLFRRELIFSNAGNTSAMYSVKAIHIGLWNTMKLLIAGAGPVVAIAGIASWLLLHCSSPAERKKLALLAIPAVVMLAICVLVGAGKPAEFGRFLLLPHVILLIGLLIAIGRLTLPWLRYAAVVLVLAATGVYGVPYLNGFIADSNETGTRYLVARQLEGQQPTSITIPAEPAPYCLPPVNLFNTKLILALDKNLPAGDFALYPTDYVMTDKKETVYHSVTPISWADKPFVVHKR